MEEHLEILRERESLLRFLFGLTKSQFECYLFLLGQMEMRERGTCVRDLTEERSITRSIAQRQLHQFFKAGLVSRESITLVEFKKRCLENKKNYDMPEGKKGYTYVYHPITYRKLLELIEDRLKNIHGEIHSLSESYLKK